MTIPATIGINISKLTSVAVPTFNFTSNVSNPSSFIPFALHQANVLTNNMYGFFIMAVVSIMLFKVFSDKTIYGKMFYTDLRSICLAFGTSSILGAVMIEIGWITNYRHVILFGILSVAFMIATMIFEKPQEG